MEHQNIDILETFTVATIPDLDIVVLGALELFIKNNSLKMPQIEYTRPLVIGSGNAEATGRIIFEKTDAIFASESTYESALKNSSTIDGVVIISASGGKDAPHIVTKVKEFRKKVTLITNTTHSEASTLLISSDGDNEYIFPKNREPYTYNTSTYMGMILGYTQEDPGRIYSYIKEVIDTVDFSKMASYSAFYLIVPTSFSGIIRMLNIKFMELFGRTIARDIETSEYVRHATTVVPSQELFISFGANNTLWGQEDNRLTIPLPEWADHGAMMAIAYYVIGKIQKQHPAYFKDNIAAYTEEISTVFRERIHPIVD